MRAALAAIAAAALVVAIGYAVYDASRSPAAPPGPGSPSGALVTPAAPPTSPVEGIVVAVDATGLADVRGFTLRTVDGRQLTFTLDRLENGAEFPPGHLTAHQADAAPIRVTFTVEDDVLAATRLEDVRNP